MGEAIVVLLPDVRSKQVVQRRVLRRHGSSSVTFNDFACWLNIESTIRKKAS